jgi:hypothetical protein
VSRDERTYGTVRDKYDRWVEAERVRAPRDRLRRTDTYAPATRGNSDMSRLVFAVIGFGIGVILLALSGYAFYSASYWASYGRDGAQVGYILTAVFLLIAGAGGIAAVYNHNFRVLVRPPEHH